MTNDQFRPMEPHMHEHSHMNRGCVSWTAIFIGALVAVGIVFLLNLFNMGIGLAAFTASPNGMMVLAIGGLLGLIIGTIIAMFVAGWVAGHIAGYLTHYHPFNRHLGVLHGFAAWSVALIISVVLIASHVNLVTYGSQFFYNNTPVTQSVPVANSESGTVATQTVANAPVVSTNTERTNTNVLAMGAFTTFIIFFLGALASCFGGYCGHKRRDCVCEANKIDPNRV